MEVKFIVEDYDVMFRVPTLNQQTVIRAASEHLSTQSIEDIRMVMWALYTTLFISFNNRKGDSFELKNSDESRAEFAKIFHSHPKLIGTIGKVLVQFAQGKRADFIDLDGTQLPNVHLVRSSPTLLN